MTAWNKYWKNGVNKENIYNLKFEIFQFQKFNPNIIYFEIL